MEEPKVVRIQLGSVVDPAGTTAPAQEPLSEGAGEAAGEGLACDSVEQMPQLLIPQNPWIYLKTDHVPTLEAFIKDALEHADEVASKVNPTNIFARRYTALADAAEALIALFNERGHTGVPTNLV